jgi:hypothetical protein
LRQSVKLLYANYNAAARDDVIFFHTGDITESEQRGVLALCHDQARFLRLPAHHFQLPAGVNTSSSTRRWRLGRKVSIGYRHMVRFFTMGIWDDVAALGYTHLLRLDEDSFLWSPIRYNLFEFMSTHGLDYGYRLGGWERAFETRFGGPLNAVHAVVRGYAQDNGLDPRWLLDTCVPSARLTVNFSIHNCGNMYIFYNNFFITRVGFWRHWRVQAFLRYINSTQSIYYERLGDAFWHSATAALFMNASRLHMFHDFAYEHTTQKLVTRTTTRRVNGSSVVSVEGNRTCLFYGGMVLAERNTTGASSSSPSDRNVTDPAHQRLTELLRIAATGHCDAQEHSDALKDRACLHMVRKRVRGVWQGTGVTIEQTRCGLEPQPFHCSVKPEVWAELQVQHMARGPRDQSVIVGLQALQRQHVCANWCPPAPRTSRAPNRSADQRAVQQQRALMRNWSTCTARSWRLWTALLHARPPL